MCFYKKSLNQLIWNICYSFKAVLLSKALSKYKCDCCRWVSKEFKINFWILKKNNIYFEYSVKRRKKKENITDCFGLLFLCHMWGFFIFTQSWKRKFWKNFRKNGENIKWNFFCFSIWVSDLGKIKQVLSNVDY